MNYKLTLCALCVMVVLRSSAHAADVPRFEPAPCRDLPDIADVLPRLRCGVVHVPRDHAHPDGPSFALAVVVIASAQQPARPDPVVYISGGPGGPLTIYAGFQARHPYAAARDLILVDQRGMGRSEPHLCPELQDTLVTAMLDVDPGERCRPQRPAFQPVRAGPGGGLHRGAGSGERHGLRSEE